MLNKNGWGLRVELLFIAIFLVCLLVATIGLRRFGLFGNPSALDKDYYRASYSELETKMNDAAKRYYQNNYSSDEEGVLIIKSYTLLFNGYMTDLVDENGNKCSGYTKVIRTIDSNTFTTYINCPNYKTSGYEYE